MIGMLITTTLFLLVYILLSNIYFNFSFREKAVYSIFFYDFITFLFIESASLFNVISFKSIIIFWCVVLFVLLALTLYFFKSGANNIKFDYRFFTKKEHLFPTCIIVIYVLTLGFIAIYFPPNNWDSMTYHLPRVMHWIQNENIEHYPTNIIWQNYQPPFAEYMILNFVLSTGHIHSANMVQFIAYIGCIILVSLHIKIIGGNEKKQVFGAAVAATVPMAVLQATSTQNDLLLAFFILIAHYQIYKTKYYTFFDFFLIAVSSGFACITKGTSFLFLAPISVYFIYNVFSSAINYKKNYSFVAAGFIFILVITPHYYRNFKEYGHPLGTEADQNTHKSEYYSIRASVSQIVKNYAINLATPFYGVNDDIDFIVQKAHQLMGFDINHYTLTRGLWNDSILKSDPKSQFFDEDYAPNVLVFVLFLTLIPFFIKMKKENRFAFNMWLLTIVAFFLLSSMLKWSPWHTRYHIVSAMLWIPFIVLALPNYMQLRTFILIAAILASHKHLFGRSMKQIFPLKNISSKSDIDVVFTKRMNIKNDYVSVMNELNTHKINQTGLFIGIDDWEFPIWYLSKKNNLDLKIYHVNSNTQIPIYYIISTFKNDSLQINQKSFHRITNYEHLNLYTSIALATK